MLEMPQVLMTAGHVSQPIVLPSLILSDSFPIQRALAQFALSCIVLSVDHGCFPRKN